MDIPENLMAQIDEDEKKEMSMEDFFKGLKYMDINFVDARGCDIKNQVYIQQKELINAMIETGFTPNDKHNEDFNIRYTGPTVIG